jgi:tetratricopeptide (TPR) repeat protein
MAIEGIQWINATLIAPSSPSDRAYVVGRIAAGRLSFRTGNHRRSAVWLEEALRLAQVMGDGRLIFDAMAGLGYVTPNYDQAVQLETEAIRMAGESGWEEEIALCLFYLGRQMNSHGHYEGAIQTLSKGLRLARDQNDDLLMAYFLGELGVSATRRGDYVQARASFEESATCYHCTHVRRPHCDCTWANRASYAWHISAP